MNNPEILVIDDEQQICRLLAITLESNDYKVHIANSSREGIIAAAQYSPELIILDIGLPDESGHETLTKLRSWFNKPIIVLSVLHDELNIVKALDNGANDYLVKPFRTGELLARMRSALRNTLVNDESSIINCEGLVIDLAGRSVRKDGEYIKLTATEFTLLSVLANNEGKILTHQFLLRHIWGPGYIGQSQYLRVFIAQLRKKIEKDPNQPELLITAFGIGYRFVCNP
ncbi:MAG: response regulator [Bacteroidetes bacterium]|nr:response regulator [Bacteroidota bacterium]